MKALLVNGFPGQTTNRDLASALKKAGYEVEVFSAITQSQNGGHTPAVEVSLLELQKALNEKVAALAQTGAPALLIGYCYGSWLLARVLKELNLQEEKSIRVVHIAPLFNLRTFRLYHESKGNPLTSYLFGPTLGVIPGDPLKWESQWLEQELQTIDHTHFKTSKFIESQTDTHLDPQNRDLEKLSDSKNFFKVHSPDHAFTGSRGELVNTMITASAEFASR